MRIVVRTDASLAIATGHVARTLTLAVALSEQGHNVQYVCRQLDGNLSDFVEKQGFKVHRLPFDNELRRAGLKLEGYARWLGVDFKVDLQETLSILDDKNNSPDWLIVDHYGLDYRWESGLRGSVRRILVIDDLADRRHDCDLLLDQNYYAEPDHRYEGLVSEDCGLMLGPCFALLRKEFSKARQTVRKRNGRIDRLMMFFGGADPGNETMKAIEALQQLGDNRPTVDIIVGAVNPHRQEIERACTTLPEVNCLYGVDNMAELMNRADLALGASGTSTWERCSLGLPALLVSVATNQELIGHGAAGLGVARYLGSAEEVTAEKLVTELEELATAPEVLSEMSRRGTELVDGQGVSRVLAQMQALDKEKD